MASDLKQKVLDAAREWMTERQPHDRAEKELFVAAARAWPEDLACKEDCDCGEQDECDECPSRAQTESALARLEQELIVPA